MDVSPSVEVWVWGWKFMVWDVGFNDFCVGFGWIMLDYDMRYVNIASCWHALLYGFYNLFATFEY